MRRFEATTRWWLALVTVLAGLYTGGTVVAPWLASHGLVAGSWLRLAYSPACHQQPDRCLDLGNGPLAVCARCAGLYAGGVLALAAAAVTGIRSHPTLRLLVITAVPTVVDFGAALVGLPSLPSWPRFAVALTPGIVLGLLLADGIADVVAHVGRPEPKISYNGEHPRRRP